MAKRAPARQAKARAEARIVAGESGTPAPSRQAAKPSGSEIKPRGAEMTGQRPQPEGREPKKDVAAVVESGKKRAQAKLAERREQKGGQERQPQGRPHHEREQAQAASTPAGTPAGASQGGRKTAVSMDKRAKV